MHRDKYNKFDRCFYYIVLAALLIIGAITLAVILRYELTSLTVIIIGILIASVVILVLIQKSANRSLKASVFVGLLPCRKGFIKKTDNGIEYCHRCVPFHFSIWPIVAFILAAPSVNGQYLWHSFYKLLIWATGDIGYLIMVGLFLLSIPIDACATEKLHKSSSDKRRTITSLLTTIGISLAIIYLLETAPIWQSLLGSIQTRNTTT